ncbi:MAG: hypothetical protein GY821_08605 [Gammaproteobacteria bacterium]|nr:hypothetical protein [Gammaproteobacteria bacterium]
MSTMETRQIEARQADALLTVKALEQLKKTCSDSGEKVDRLSAIFSDFIVVAQKNKGECGQPSTDDLAKRIGLLISMLDSCLKHYIAFFAIIIITGFCVKISAL